MNIPANGLAAVRTGAKTSVYSATLAVFLAALAPMVTVPAIRRLVMEAHGGSAAAVHVFVAVGMIGSALGAPLIAAKVDARGDHVRIAAVLASVDAVVTLLTSSAIPTSLLFVLRPVHGMASMGLLALLFAQFRRSGGGLVAYAGSAMIAALALGPALGGVLSKLGPGVPFRAAAAISAVLALTLFARATGRTVAIAHRSVGSAAFRDALKPIVAPLLVAASQRFAIGGLVAAFAVHARVVHGLSDARVGACFSTLLVVFAIAMVALGRTRDAQRLTRLVPLGAILFGASFVAIALAPRSFLMLALAAAGFSAALVYAPCLALVSAASVDRTRATSMALLHAAGAVGMIVGPLVAAAIDVAMRGSAPSLRGAVFMAFAGAAHGVTAAVLTSRLGALADASNTVNATTSQRIS